MGNAHHQTSYSSRRGTRASPLESVRAADAPVIRAPNHGATRSTQPLPLESAAAAPAPASASASNAAVIRAPKRDLVIGPAALGSR